MRVAEIDRLVRAVTRPYPGAFLDTPGGRLRIWSGSIENPTRDPSPIRIHALDGEYFVSDYEHESTILETS